MGKRNAGLSSVIDIRGDHPGSEEAATSRSRGASTGDRRHAAPLAVPAEAPLINWNINWNADAVGSIRCVNRARSQLLLFRRNSIHHGPRSSDGHLGNQVGNTIADCDASG
jgi:hypothetical protein